MKRQPKSDGGYYVAPAAMQLSAGLQLPSGHAASRCQWCRAYERGTERSPCPDQPQLELFAATGAPR